MLDDVVLDTVRVQSRWRPSLRHRITAWQYIWRRCSPEQRHRVLMFDAEMERQFLFGPLRCDA